MLGFMDYVQRAFYISTQWDEDNSYANLNATARALLDFPTPRGWKMNLSSLSSPNFATSYSMAGLGVVDGSVSYLYSSRPLLNVENSSKVDLHDIVDGYRALDELRKPEDKLYWEIWRGGYRVDKRDTLLYGRMYLPTSTLEALYLRRSSPSRLTKLSMVSDARLKNGGTILATMQKATGKWSAECLYSTDVGLVGARGLYNFGFDPRKPTPVALTEEGKIHGRFSAGAEVYYGILNKSGGLSTGIRYVSLPSNVGTPITVTLIVNPVMGHFSATYAVRAGTKAAFCSRLNFNMYSYESDLVLGFELWRRRRSNPISEEFGATPSQAIPVNLDDDTNDSGVTGVLKGRITQNFNIGVLWEGRFKQLLFTIGSTIDLKRRDQPFRAIGLEVQYNS